MCTYMHGRDDTHREFQYTNNLICLIVNSFLKI